jgi:tRNA 2-thiouridine synthesizing protein A
MSDAPAATSTAPGEPRRVDARGQLCPLPILLLARAAAKAAAGDVIELLGTDPAIPADLASWCQSTGHQLLAVGRCDGDTIRGRIRIAATTPRQRAPARP